MNRVCVNQMISMCFFVFKEDVFGSMMTYLEKDVLPFPHVKRIDLGPAMKRKVIHKKKK